MPRVFHSLFVHVRWLNAFSKINFIAIQKIIRKYSKTFFILKDNVISHKMLIYVEKKELVKRQKVLALKLRIIDFYAQHFTKGSTKKAQQVLEGHHTEVRRKDALLMTFFCGITSVMVFFFAIFLATRGSDGKYIQHINEWAASFPVFRFLLVLIFILAACSVDISILKANRVNFQYIFELDPNYRMS